MMMPTGNSLVGRGFGGWGLQTNLPASITHGRYVVTHWNAGLTWIPSAQNAAREHAALWNPNLGQSTVFLIRPRFNALCEIAWSSNATVVGKGHATRTQNLVLNPGVRWAYNFASGLQIVPGIGVPLGIGPSAGQRGMMLYLSFEHNLGMPKSR